MKSKKTPRENHPAALRQAVLRKLAPRIDTKGEVSLPAVPALLDPYTEKLLTLFAALGRKFNEPEAQKLREILEPASWSVTRPSRRRYRRFRTTSRSTSSR